MTSDQAQSYLYALTTGDAALHHQFDPMDYDGCPFQQMAATFDPGEDEGASQEPQLAVSGALAA